MMRTVKFTWNVRLNSEANYSLATEILVEDGEAYHAGRTAFTFLTEMQQGMIDAAEEGETTK